MGLKRSPMPRGSGFKPRTVPLKANALQRIERKEAAASTKAGRGMKTRQRTVTPDEKAMWTRLAALGCIACMKDGHYNPHVSIHHCDGRTKPDCHKKVLALCAPHHQQDDTDPAQRISVHGNKARFEAHYGTQAELMAESQYLLNKSGTAASVEQAAIPEQNSHEEIYV